MDLEHELELFYPFEEEEESFPEVKSAIVNSSSFQQLSDEIIQLKQKLSETSRPGERAMIEKTLEQKNLELEAMRSNVNTLYETFSGKRDVDQVKMDEARGLFEKGDFEAATSALE